MDRPGDVPVLRRERAILAAILVLALALRVVFVLQMRASPYFEDPQLDQRLFVDWGRAVARGEAFRPGVFLTAPLYPWFLGLVFRLTGGSLLAARLVQAVLGTLAVALVHRLGRRAFGPAVGLLAAFFAATYWLLLYYDAELLREGPGNLANLAALVAALALARRPTPACSVLAGLAFGVSALLRQQILLFVPCAAVWLLLSARVRLPLVLLFLASVAAPILPITAHNVLAAGDFVAISAEGGQTLWIGNNPNADGVTGVTPDTRADVLGHFEDGRAIAEREAGRPLTDSETSAHYVRKTLGFVREHPGAEAALLARKARLLVTDWEFGNPEEPRFFAERFAPVVRWLPLGFGAALALAALGLAVSWRGASARFPLWGFLLVSGATVVAFLVSARYRAPLIPVLLVYAACGAAWLARAALARRYGPLAAGLAACALVLAASRSYPVPKEASQASGLYWLAIAESRAGRSAEAVRLLREATALFPGSCAAQAALGVNLHAEGRAEEAIAALERALELCPDDVLALDTLAELQLGAGRPVEAEALARRSIAAAPHLRRGYYELGRAAADQGRLAEAAEAFRAALERGPDSFNSAYALGRVELALGRDAPAIEALARAVASPERVEASFLADAYGQLAQALRRAGRGEEALRYESEAGRRLAGH
jgi:tetratricopeptide (TPR) repeat protein